MVRSPAFDARQEVVLVGRPEGDDGAALGAGPGDSLREVPIVRDDPEQVALEARTDRAAAVILTDGFAPGWSASVNGRPVPVLAANYLGRGVVVPAGENRVDFVYRAPGLRAGFALALIGWSVVATGAVLRRRWRRHL